MLQMLPNSFKPSINLQRFVQFRQSGKISPNLATLSAIEDILVGSVTANER